MQEPVEVLCGAPHFLQAPCPQTCTKENLLPLGLQVQIQVSIVYVCVCVRVCVCMRGTPHLLQATRTQSCTKENLPLSSDTGQCNMCMCVCVWSTTPSGYSPHILFVPKVKGPIVKEPSLNVNVKILGKIWCTTVLFDSPGDCMCVTL